MTTPRTPPRAKTTLGPPLVVPTKLRPPHTQDRLLDRADLTERLRTGSERALTLVCAPAGYGKTTLLAQWARTDADRKTFAWVSIDELDSDPARLWGHVITALQEVHAPVGERSLGAFAAGPTSISETGIPLLITELSDCPPIALILDDWHLVSSRVGDETMSAFVTHAPPAVQVVVSSRRDPGLPIARLRAHGELTEIRARDLRVSSEGAAELLHGAGVRLTATDVELLNERTEGWLAGLWLAALALKEHEEPDRFVREFSDDTRYVFDYLARDVLATTDPETRAFMVRSSVLDTLSGDLCDDVLERSHSASLLADIDRSSLFLVPLDEAGSEYRYHHLFAAVLRRELETTDPGSVPELHTRASVWHEKRGNVEPAIDHAISSRDVARASVLVTRAAVPLLSAGRMATLNRWFDKLSWPEARADRELALMRALAAPLSGHSRNDVERWLAIAEDGPDFGPLAIGVSSMSAGVAMVSSTYLSRGIADAERSAALGLETEPQGSPWRYASLVPLGQARFLAGRPAEARQPLEEALTLPGARGRATTVLALAYLALVELSVGDDARSETLARDALALATDIGHSASAAAANPQIALGCALMRGTDVHAAVEHLERAAELALADAASYWHAHALIHLAAARHRVGDAGGARATLSRARRELDELPDVGMLGDLYHETADALQHRPRRDGFRGEELSDAEKRVLERLLRGLSVSQVANELWLSPNTVKTHRRGIYRKLGVTTREELLERAPELELDMDPATVSDSR